MVLGGFGGLTGDTVSILVSICVHVISEVG